MMKPDKYPDVNSFYKKMLSAFRYSLDKPSAAYVYYDEKYTYAEMYLAMTKLNSLLCQKKNKKIALYGTKTFPVYSAIYAIILSGNVWIPLTPGLPANRLVSMLEILDADVIIFEEELPQEVKSFAAKDKIELWNLTDIMKQDKKVDFKDPDFSPDDWEKSAYIMFTSGSTGVPKGVPMTHVNYINFVNNALEILPFKKGGEVFSDYHDFAFDISIFYLFCAPLTKSAISPIRKKEERIFPLAHMQKNKITVWSSVPSVISCMQRLRPSEKLENSIKIMFLCGEPFNLSVLEYCYNNLDIKHVYDFYGLTETGVENFYHKCSPGDLKRFKDKGFVPIGRPLKGNDIKVTEDKELLLSGCQITPGYLGGVGKERFETIDGKVWYHTGDIVEKFEVEPGKYVYFCKGRLDSQVKISGHRIELMDIEVHIKQHPQVKEAVCFVDETSTLLRLICAIEKSGSEEFNETALTWYLKDKLPDYMIPKKFFVLDQMPTNKNGKIDRKAIKQDYMEEQKRQLV